MEGGELDRLEPATPAPQPSPHVSYPTLWESIVSVRSMICLLAFMGLFIAYAIRVVMSSTVGPIADAYGYDSQEIGLILSSFFIGYVGLQILGGYWSTKYGATTVIGISLASASLCTALTPLVAHSLTGLVFLRILTGLSESVLYPSVHALLGKWAPKDERSILLSTVWSGAYIGTCVTLPMASAMIANTDPTASVLTRGWPAAFYILGVLGAAWCVLWYFLASSSPDQHSFISKREMNYIDMNTMSSVSSPRSSSGNSHRIPWRNLLTHPAMIALSIAHAAHNWLYYVLLTWLPEFMRQQLQFDIKQIGGVAALPYLLCFVCSIAAGIIADYALSKRLASRTAVRKIAQTVGEVIPAVAVVLAGYLTDVTAVVVMLTLSVGISGASNAGFGSSHLDIAPQYAGVLFGFANTIATLPGIVAPIVVGAMVAPPNNDIYHWRQAFWLSAGICLAGWLVFVGFVEAKPIDFDARGRANEGNEEKVGLQEKQAEATP